MTVVHSSPVAQTSRRAPTSSSVVAASIMRAGRPPVRSVVSPESGIGVISGMRQSVARMPRQDLQRMHQRLWRARGGEQVEHVLLVHHHAAEDGEFRDRLAHQAEQFLEPAAVERDSFQHAALQGRAGQIAVVIGVQRARPETNMRLLFELRHRRAAVAQERHAQRFRRLVAHRVAQIKRRLVDAIVRADRRRMMRIGNPRATGRPGAGAAETIGVFHQQPPQPGDRREQRRRQSGYAGAGHDDVESLPIGDIGQCVGTHRMLPTGPVTAIMLNIYSTWKQNHIQSAS